MSIVALAALAMGCGGGGGSAGAGQVSGKVTDINNNAVAGATISVAGSTATTTTNAEGTYVVQNVPTQNTEITANATLSGTAYVGSNVAWVNDGQRSESLNIVVVPQNQTATVDALVFDNQGNALENAWVYAMPANSTLKSSATAQTDSNGECWIHNLLAGQNYKLMAVAGGYQSSPDNVNLAVGETRTINFTLGNVSNPALSPPTGISAVSWTTPMEITRQPNSTAVYDAIKTRLVPRRTAKKYTSRSTIEGNNIEVDLFWTPLTTTDPGDTNQLYGYGIYRGLGAGATTVNVNYAWDPLASFFADLDDALVENQTYTYQMTSLNSSFTSGTTGSESAKSGPVMVTTLGDMDLGNLQASPLTFNWNAAIGATEYRVFVFDQYPSLASLAPIWTSPSTSGTQAVYSGPALASGHVYYYYVVGDNGANGYTVSQISQFSAS